MIKENTPTLVTDRLILRKFEEKDIDDMLLLYSDKEVNRFLPWFPMESRIEVEKYLYNNIFPFYEMQVAYSYAITQKADNRVIGYVHMNDIGMSNDMGYALRKEFWYKGIVTEACKVVIERLQKANFPFLTATHDVKNPRSGEVMKRLGMTYRYSYEEVWQPKNTLVTFKMYQLDFNDQVGTYMGYKLK